MSDKPLLTDKTASAIGVTGSYRGDRENGTVPTCNFSRLDGLKSFALAHLA